MLTTGRASVLARQRLMKRALIALALALVVAPALLVLYFMYLFDWNRARDPLSTAASGHAGRKIVIKGDLRPEWGWPISRLHAAGLAVDNVKGGSVPVMLELESIDLAIDVSRLFKGVLEFTDLVLVKPRLLLEKTAEGATNWRFSDNPAGGVALGWLPDERGEFPIIGHLAIIDGQIGYKDPATKTDVSLHAATVQGAADEPAQGIHFDGKGVLQGQAFRFKLAGGSVQALRDANTRYPVSASIEAGQTSAQIVGTVTDPVMMKGLDVRLTASGANAAELFPLTGIAFLPSPPYKVEGQLTYTDGVWTLHKFDGRLGDSDLAGDLSWDIRPPRPLLTGSFTSRELDFDDLGSFIGAGPGIGPGETASAAQRAKGAADKSDPRLLPDMPLDISRLAAMDAKVEFRGLRVVATKLPVDNFYVKLELDDRLLKITPVRFGSGHGDISMWMTINARHEPVHIDSKLEVRQIPIAPLFERASAVIGKPNLAKGFIGGTAEFAGTGKSLRAMLATANGNLGIGMEGGQLSQLVVELIGLDIAESLGYLIVGDRPVPIRCVIADFKVDNGVMTPRAFVVDTDDTVVTGSGAINLRDESLQLELKPAPKDFSPLALRMPLKVGGTLKNPAFNVDAAGLLARGAAAVALVLVFPPAALIAFIEPGLGKDSQCAAMLTDMARSSGDKRKNEGLIPTNK